MEKIIFFLETERAMACKARFEARELLTFFLSAGVQGYCDDGTLSNPTLHFWNYLKPQLAEQEMKLAALTEKLVNTVSGKKELRLKKGSLAAVKLLCENFKAQFGSDSPRYAVWEKLEAKLNQAERKEKGKIYFDLWAFVNGTRNLPQLKAVNALVGWPQLDKAIAKAELAFEKAVRARKKAIEAMESLDALTPAERHEAKNIILAGL